MASGRRSVSHARILREVLRWFSEVFEEHVRVNRLDEVVLEADLFTTLASVIRTVGRDGDESCVLSCQVLTHGDASPRPKTWSPSAFPGESPAGHDALEPLE